MPRRLRIIFRALSAITLLESIFGVLLTALAMFSFPFIRATLEKNVVHPHHPALVFYTMALANVGFSVVLVIASVFLWKLQRRGLFLLACTLLAETLYFISVLFVVVGTELIRAHIALLTLAQSPSESTLDAMTGVGNMAVVVHLLTAFPIVAGILILFAYRYHRSYPARIAS